MRAEAGATLVWFTLLSASAFAIARFDVAQFEFRYNALFTVMETSDEALSWAPDEILRLGEYVARFVAVARWGYVALIAANALVVEYAFERSGERWRALGRGWDELVNPQDVQPDRRDVEGAPRPQPEGQVLEGVQNRITNHDEPGHAVNTAPTTTGSVHGPRAEPVPVPPPPSAEALAATPPPQEEVAVDVLIGPGGIGRFPLSEVLRDARRFVRDGSGRQWFLREYYDQWIGGDPHQGPLSEPETDHHTHEEDAHA